MSRAVLDLVEIRMNLTGNVSENMSEAAGMLKTLPRTFTPEKHCYFHGSCLIGNYSGFGPKTILELSGKCS